MKAVETAAVADMYNYMTGVKRAGNQAYDITIRGFKTSNTDKNAIMVDGLPGLSGKFASPPTIGVERVELVKGPMSVLYGQIQPGGFVNMITKKPRTTQAFEVDVRGQTYFGDKPSFGDRNGYAASADLTGPIDKDGKFLYRLIGEYSDRDLFRDYTNEKSNYFAPGLTWNISELTYVTLQYDHRYVKNAYDDGLAAPGFDINRVASRTTYYHEPGDAREETGDAYSMQAAHTFNDNLTWNFAARSVTNTNDDKAFASVAVRPNGTSLQRRARLLHAKNDYNYLDTNLNAQFKTAFVEHKVIFGINAGEDKAHQWRERFFNSGACPGPTCIDIDIYNPVYGRVPAMEDLPAFSAANLRQDRYHEPARFLTEVLETVRAAAPGLALGLRLSADSPAARAVAPALAPLVDYLHVAVGNSATFDGCSGIVPPPPAPRNLIAPLTGPFRLGPPLIATSRIVDPVEADEMIGRGAADAVGMTRALITDPAASVTSYPSPARSSAQSRAAASPPQSAISTRPFGRAPARTSQTCRSSTPASFCCGGTGRAPVATITRSGWRAVMASASAAVPSRSSTLPRPSRTW